MHRSMIVIILFLITPVFSQLPGDFNCDGVVTGSDIHYIISLIWCGNYCDYLMECTIENGDVNGDGFPLTVGDFLGLVLFFRGIDFPDFPRHPESDTLIIESLSTSPGGNLCLPIYLKTIDTLSAFQFYLVADTNYVSLDSVLNPEGFSIRHYGCWGNIQLLFSSNNTIHVLPGEYYIGDLHASVSSDIDEPVTTQIQFSYDTTYAFNTGLANLTFFQPVLVNSEIQITPVGIGSDETPNLPDLTAIKAYPNPFNSTLKIAVSCPIESELVIYDLLGRVVRTFPVNSGENSFIWEATDENNKPVKTGVYFAIIKGTSPAQAEKILLIK
jgi:hypothetical protein